MLPIFAVVLDAFVVAALDRAHFGMISGLTMNLDTRRLGRGDGVLAAVEAVNGLRSDDHSFSPSQLLRDLDSCNSDPVAVASCFVERSQEFDIYTQYCNNYPK